MSARDITIEDRSRAKREALAALQAKMKPPHPPQDAAGRARMSNKMMNLRREIQTLDTEKDDAAQQLADGELNWLTHSVAARSIAPSTHCDWAPRAETEAGLSRAPLI